MFWYLGERAGKGLLHHRLPRPRRPYDADAVPGNTGAVPDVVSLEELYALARPLLRLVVLPSNRPPVSVPRFAIALRGFATPPSPRRTAHTPLLSTRHRYCPTRLRCPPTRLSDCYHWHSCASS
eukprot:1224447-Rhodomonas_salina.2